MRVLALVSGGKDSCYCILQCIKAGHQVVGLGHLKPADETTEADSYMYQTAGHELLPLFAEAIGLSLTTRVVTGTAELVGKTYLPTVGDEVEDLYELLKAARDRFAFDAVASGAIWSNYQRVRVENVCARLGLTSLAYMWRREQEDMLQEMLNAGMKAMVVKVACFGLQPDKHLGRDLNELQEHLTALHKKFGINVCGEGGEYETFTLDCPLFKKKIIVDDWETVIHSDDAFAPVAFARIKQAHLEGKCNVPDCLSERLAKTKIKNSLDFIEHEILTDAPCDNDDDELVGSKCIVEPIDYHPLDDPFVSEDASGTIFIGNLIGSSKWENSLSDGVREVMKKVESVLLDKSLTWDNLVFVDVVLKDMALFKEFNDEYKKFFSVNPPARACVALDTINACFTVNCVAFRGEKDVLHVQSISDWAPANIGPYSQAVVTKDRLFVAGQIALVPGSMEMLNAGIVPQNRLVLRHIDRVLAALHEVKLKDIVAATCYVTSLNNVDRAVSEFRERVKNANVIVLQVSELPRKAKIEWQVVARNPSDPYQEKSELRVERGSLEACVQITKYAKSAYFYLEIHKHSIEDLLEDDLIEIICDALHRIEVDLVSRAKVYFKSNAVTLTPDTYVRLQTEMKTSAFDVTPVIGFGTKDCIFAIVLETSYT